MLLKMGFGIHSPILKLDLKRDHRPIKYRSMVPFSNGSEYSFTGLLNNVNAWLVIGDHSATTVAYRMIFWFQMLPDCTCLSITSSILWRKFKNSMSLQCS